MDQDTLARHIHENHVIPYTAKHIPPDNCEILRIDAHRALANQQHL